MAASRRRRRDAVTSDPPDTPALELETEAGAYIITDLLRYLAAEQTS